MEVLGGVGGWVASYHETDTWHICNTKSRHIIICQVRGKESLTKSSNYLAIAWVWYGFIHGH